MVKLMDDNVVFGVKLQHINIMSDSKNVILRFSSQGGLVSCRPVSFAAW